MRSLTLSFFALLMLSLQVQAQRTISSSEIIEKINRGETVRYENVEIEGVLDLTDLENRQLVKKDNKWFGSDSEQYESQVEVSLTFVKCTFRDDVLAYYNDDNRTFIANFEDDVVFSQCSFLRDSEFKYSEFPREADFSNSIFEENANFKYAEFERGPDFSQCVFEEEANFKYAEFDDQPLFAGVVFEDDANFKYANFPDGVSFEGSVFNELANFKYSKFSEPLNLDNAVFNGDEDFKYTKINGKDFTTYLLKNR